MLTIWGNEHCKQCAKLGQKLEKYGVPYIASALTEDALYSMKDTNLRNEIYGMLQWQDRELPVVTLDDKAITWEELDQLLGA